MTLKNKYILLIMTLALGVLAGVCRKEDGISGEAYPEEAVESVSGEGLEETEDEAEQIEKGYGLAVNDSEREEAERDCNRRMDLIYDIYKQTGKDESSNAASYNEMVLAMQYRLKEAGCPVTTMLTYSDMENYESVDRFLRECEEGVSGSEVIYVIYSDGGIGRRKYIFDGSDMYVLSARVPWDKEDRPGSVCATYTRIKEWEYTEKGWFSYELCVPEPPEVTELVDGSCYIRIKPMTSEQRRMSEICVRGIGYQGNNLLCSNWDAGHMEELDYNGLYEYLYEMKYQEKFYLEDYTDGIHREEFEGLIMEYLPVTAEQIREYAVFDEDTQAYAWVRLGCLNYAPAFFGASIPEVTGIKENEDGTVTLTVDATGGGAFGDAVITHELTVLFAEGGSFQYMGNRILNVGIRNIPEYQYRIDRNRI